MARRLNRSTDGRPAADVRIVHLGLGNFFRAHQAWYTDRAPDAAQWGIAAFAGRSMGIGAELSRQQNLYTLVSVGSELNDYRVISSISAAHSGRDVAALLDYFVRPEVSVVTMTITEAGYLCNEQGRLDTSNPDVADDIEQVGSGNLVAVRTAPGKLAAGLLSRSRAGAGPITLVCCDNVPDNGTMLATVLGDFVREACPEASTYLDEQVGFITTMVDRITPRATDATRQAVLDEQGVDDPAALATEPFSEWVLAGEFKGPRPAWDAVGAEFVDDVVPHETRKLWLLNGAHSLMAYAATIVGHATVADAIADPIVRGWVDEWWDVTQRHLELPDDVIADYRAALLQRFSNPRMKDQLSRIAADGSQKLPIRIVPALLADRKAGNSPLGAERAVAAWTLHLRGRGAPFNDARSDKIAHLSDGSLEDSVDKVCEFLEIDDRDSKASILTLARQLGAEMGHAPAGSRVVIGLDVGTTAAKVSAFALGGGWRTGAGHEYPLQQPRPGWEVQDPEVMWRALHEGLADVASELGDAQVVGIGVSTAMHGLLALDAERRPITPLLTWADSRAAEQAMRLRDTDQGRRLHRTSGTPIHSMSHLCKLLWYAENDPDTVAAARWWVGLKDYILLQLTGELVTDLSNASGTGLLDSRAEDWNPEALELVGVRRDQLPPVRPTTDVLRLRDDLAGLVGLPQGVPVVLGAGDGPLGNLGVGALEPGVVGLSMGTSGAVRMITPEPYVDEAGKLFCYNLADGAWLIGGAISNGGIVVRWGGDVFGADFADEPGGNPDGMLLELARDVPIGADGLVMLPFLMAERAPLWNPTIPGAFLGVRRSHTRDYFVRAAVEGVALMLSAIVDELDRVSPVRQIRATGGVFRSTVWREVLAAALGRPLVVTDGAEGTALGAAALALYGLGEAASLKEALVALGADPDAGSDELVPDPDDVAAYRAVRASIPALLARYDEVRKLFS